MYRKIRVRIRYSDRSHLIILLTLTCLVAAFLGYMLFTTEKAVASPVQSTNAVILGYRSFYLTKDNFDGANALTACETGYHMASLWEILDPSNLKYNTTLGYTAADSGEGPPTTRDGWIRTGYEANTSTTPGNANCSAWTSNNESHYGSYVKLLDTWSYMSQLIFVWFPYEAHCNAAFKVWCVADVVGERLYLPLVSR